MEITNDREQAKELGRLIKQHRTHAGLSMEALAQASGVPKSSIGRLELGELQQPSPKALTRLAQALGIEVEDYFALAGYYTPQGLPDLPLYLRAKYGVPDALAREVEDYFNYHRDRDNDQAT